MTMLKTLAPYEFKSRDALENYKGKQLLYINWERHRMFSRPFVLALPPDTLFAMMTQPLKILISQTAVSMLHLFGYPIAGSGVMIQIGQYQMLVAAACAGLNSLLSLTALGMFYSYIRHSSNFPYMLVLICFILPIAVIANLVRVLLLLLITYHFGEAAGQGFFHELAGLSMFASALIAIFCIDWLGTPLRHRLAAKGRTK